MTVAFRSVLCVFVAMGCTEPSFGRIELEPAPDVELWVPPGITVDTGFGFVPRARAPMYANTFDLLFEVDPQTLDVTEVGRFFPTLGFVDIAIDLEGRLFGAANNGLHRIDPNTAETTFACPLPLSSVALTFDSNGILYGGAGDQVVTIDPDTCQTRRLSSLAGFISSGDLIGLPDGFLYWTVVGQYGGSDELVRVDPVEGRAEALGPLGAAAVWGLGFAEDTLFGFNAAGQTLEIDLQTGRASMVRSDSRSWWGATTNPVLWSRLGEEE